MYHSFTKQKGKMSIFSNFARISLRITTFNLSTNEAYDIQPA